MLSTVTPFSFIAQYSPIENCPSQYVQWVAMLRKKQECTFNNWLLPLCNTIFSLEKKKKMYNYICHGYTQKYGESAWSEVPNVPLTVPKIGFKKLKWGGGMVSQEEHKALDLWVFCGSCRICAKFMLLHPTDLSE